VQDVLLKHYINIKNCRRQEYDGASVMNGQYCGVQKKKKISDIVPTASYLHCYSHNLNLVTANASKSSERIKRFFETLQNMFNFLGSSGQR